MRLLISLIPVFVFFIKQDLDMYILIYRKIINYPDLDQSINPAMQPYFLIHVYTLTSGLLYRLKDNGVGMANVGNKKTKKPALTQDRPKNNGQQFLRLLDFNYFRVEFYGGVGRCELLKFTFLHQIHSYFLGHDLYGFAVGSMRRCQYLYF